MKLDIETKESQDRFRVYIYEGDNVVGTFRVTEITLDGKEL